MGTISKPSTDPLLHRAFLVEIEEQLLRRSEFSHVEYKAGFQWDEKSSIGDGRILAHRVVKSILCFANREDGGRIIIGFDEGKQQCDLTDEQYDSFDVTKIHLLLHKFASPPFDVEIKKAQLLGVYDESLKDKRIIVIDVREFDSVPILCKKDYQVDGKHPILVEGMLYHRSGKSNAENKMELESMRNIIDRATAKNGEKLLSQIYGLFKASGFPLDGKVINSSTERYGKQIEDALQRIVKGGDDKNG